MAGEERVVPGWDEYFLNMIDSVKARSKDRSVQVGCIIVGEGQSVLSMGYNGFPRGIREKIDSRHERPIKYKFTEHAERNAIYNAARNGIRLLDSTIYVKVWPCTDCARAIIQSGIKRIVMDGRGYQENVKAWSERWEEDFTIALEMIAEAGIDRLIWKPGGRTGFANHLNWKDIG